MSTPTATRNQPHTLLMISLSLIHISVLDLSLSFMIVGLVGLLITRIANWRFLKHNPNYRKKRLAATTRRRWPWQRF